MGAVSNFVNDVGTAIVGQPQAMSDVLRDGLSSKPSTMFTAVGDPLGAAVKKTEANSPVLSAVGPYVAGAFGSLIGMGGVAGAAANSSNAMERGDQVTAANVVSGYLAGTAGGNMMSGYQGATAGSTVPGVNAGEAGYTMTGDSIKDASVLKDMGYSDTQINSIMQTGSASGGSNLMGQLANLGIKGVSSYLTQQAQQNAAQNYANSLQGAANSAANAGKFRPVGVTTRFGSSNFTLDANGNLVDAGYLLAPDVQQHQNILMGMANPLLQQYAGAQEATSGMRDASGRMMSLGNQYLQTSPQEQAAKYLADQQALLAPGRAADMARLQAQMQAQGRGGLAVGGDAGMMASNPQMQAFLNAQRMQDLKLAADATQGGMDYAKFGGALTGLGGSMLQDMYKTQSAAYNPYQTALGGAQALEGMGSDAMSMGVNLGRATTEANQWGAGLQNKAAQMGAYPIMQSQSYSPWASAAAGYASSPQGQEAIGGMLSSAGSAIGDAWKDFSAWYSM